MINTWMRNLLIILWVGTWAGAVSAKVPEQLVVFGDSLSDNGNLAAYSQVLPQLQFLNTPPYQHGFNNGNVAVQGLAQVMGLPLTPSLHLVGPVSGNNFSVAGTVASGLDKLGQPDPLTLSSQVQAFLQSTGNQASPSGLYIIFVGGNDIRAARDASSGAIANQIINTAVDNVVGTIQALQAKGATTFLVVNVPDVGKLPETRMLSLFTQNPAISKRASRYAKSFNHKLSKSIQSLRTDLPIHLVEFDLFRFFNSLLDVQNDLGFTNGQQACFSSMTLTFNDGCSFDQYVFFDEVHPSARVHERLRRALYSVIPELVDQIQ